MTWLLVNADDAGLHADTDAAILRCRAAGLLRAASVVAGGPTARAFVAAARDVGLDLGWHVNLTEGAALAGPADSLTDPSGRFRGPKQAVWARAADNALDADAVRAELAAQWQWLAGLGAPVTHVDGHNHVHLVPVVERALRDLVPGLWFRRPRPPLPATFPAAFPAWCDAVPATWRTTTHFAGFAFCACPEAATLLAELAPRAGSVELMVHPGARPGSAFTRAAAREHECAVLCDAALHAAVAARGFQATSFADLPEDAA